MFVFRQRQRAENPPRRLRIFVKDAHLQNFLSFLKKTLDFPGGGRYNKTRSPARTPREYAPVAQLDRVSDYESEGREFESLPAHQAPHRGRDASVHFFVCIAFFKAHKQRQPIQSPLLIRFENQKKACFYSVPGSGCSPAFPRPSIPAGRFLPVGACGAAGLVAAQRLVQPTAVQKKQEQHLQFSRYNDKNPQPFHNGGGLVYLDKGQTVLYTV